jgi:hypothetical protein
MGQAANEKMSQAAHEKVRQADRVYRTHRMTRERRDARTMAAASREGR